MIRNTFIPESLEHPMSAEDIEVASDAVAGFCNTLGWYRFRQLMESYRASQIVALLDAPKRGHLELAERAGEVRAIDHVYKMFDKIIQEGEKA